MNAGMTRYLAESLGPLVPWCLVLVHTLVRFISRVLLSGLLPNSFTTTQPTLGQIQI